MGQEVHVLLETVTLHSRAIVIEVVVFMFGSMWVVVGTLSGHCLIHQLTPQFVLF